MCMVSTDSVRSISMNKIFFSFFCKHRWLTILDFIVIVINLTYSLSILGNMTIDKIPIRYVEFRLLLPIVICYHLRFGSRFYFWKNFGFRSRLLILWISFLVFEAFQGLLVFNIQCCGILILLIYYFYLFEYIYSFYLRCGNENPLVKYTSPYCIYGIYNMLIVCICAVCIGIGFFTPTDNNVSNVFPIFASNHIYKGDEYYFPGFLCIVESTYRLLVFFNIPVLDGLSYEPNSLCLSIIPSFFLSLSFLYKKKAILTFIIYLLLLATVVASTSTTAILCLFGCFFMEGLWKIVHMNNYKYLITVMVIILVVFIYFGSVFTELSSFLADTTSSDSDSRQYSEESLIYIISPTSILGNGILKGNLDGEALKNIDIGFISSVMLITLYVITVIKAVKSALSGNYIYHYIGLAGLYFLMHSLKLGVRVFDFPLFYFIIVLISISDMLFNNKRI